MKLTPRNWDDFQHYKERRPVWIKLHKNLLDDYEFHCLPVASKALAPMLWLLASEYSNGTIEDHIKKVAFRLRMSEPDFVEAVKPLISAGFFAYEDNDASTPLAECLPRDRDREEKEKENSANKLIGIGEQVPPLPEDQDGADKGSDGEDNPYGLGADDAALVGNSWNGMAEEHGLPTIQRMTRARRQKVLARAREVGLPNLITTIERVPDQPFLLGRNDRGWMIDFDWLMEPRNFVKVEEQKFRRSGNGHA
jgi:hypothetical protein